MNGRVMTWWMLSTFAAIYVGWVLGVARGLTTSNAFLVGMSVFVVMLVLLTSIWSAADEWAR